ncbi:hypothetical protein [Achromobacter aegrifaciens]
MSIRDENICASTEWVVAGILPEVVNVEGEDILIGQCFFGVFLEQLIDASEIEPPVATTYLYARYPSVDSLD